MTPLDFILLAAGIAVSIWVVVAGMALAFICGAIVSFVKGPRPRG